MPVGSVSVSVNVCRYGLIFRPHPPISMTVAPSLTMSGWINPGIPADPGGKGLKWRGSCDLTSSDNDDVSKSRHNRQLIRGRVPVAMATQHH